MTRRYGRNQRRRARERIAELEAAVVKGAEAIIAASKALGEAQSRAARAESYMRDMADRIRRACGEDSALAVPPRRNKRQPWDPYHSRTAVAPDSPGPIFARIDPVEERLEMLREELHHLVVHVERDPAGMRRLIHWIDMRDDSHGRLASIAHVMSEETIRRLGFSEAETMYLIEDIARQFVAMRNENPLRRVGWDEEERRHARAPGSEKVARP